VPLRVGHRASFTEPTGIPSPVSLTYRFGDHVRLFLSANRSGDEHPLWTRDTRFAHRFAASAGGSRVLELESGAVVIGPSRAVTDVRAAEVSREVGTVGYGLVPVVLPCLRGTAT